MANGKVVGGQFMNAVVVLTAKGDLALQVPLKLKKVRLNHDTVAKWEEIPQESRGGVAGSVVAVGQAVAGAVLPGVVGKMASAALGPTIDATIRPPRTVRIDWAGGQQSVIQLPEKLFTHFAVLLQDRQLVPASPTPPDAIEPGSPAQADVAEQIAKLAALRDQGILTEVEFATKKAELLGRI